MSRNSPLAPPVLAWYAGRARDLPWRHPDADPWAVLVSEVMLQQTPVGRVLPAYRAWLARWPTPGALAAAPPGDAVRAWGRLGYPRRALYLHRAATLIVSRHGGQVPRDVAALRALPGIGPYTAAAVAVFAFGDRHAVLDTNVARVLARLVGGTDRAGGPVTAADRARAAALLPADRRVAARWSAAVMELGALVCTARSPGCSDCPVASSCAWRRAGYPPAPRPARPQRYQGTDRQCRGALLALLRASPGPLPPATLAAAWPDAARREHALDTLAADGLVERRRDGRYQLPTTHPAPRPGAATAREPARP